MRVVGEAQCLHLPLVGSTIPAAGNEVHEQTLGPVLYLMELSEVVRSRDQLDLLARAAGHGAMADHGGASMHTVPRQAAWRVMNIGHAPLAQGRRYRTWSLVSQRLHKLVAHLRLRSCYGLPALLTDLRPAGAQPQFGVPACAVTCMATLASA